MYVNPCPRCGRQPKITEAVRGKDNVRRRIIGCPNYCNVINTGNRWFKDSWITYVGDGDDNDLYKEWNRRT